VEQVVEHFGRLDILVNNAGVTRDNLLFKMTEDDWSTVIRVHLGGAFNMTRAAQAHMVAAKYGRIINLSSTSAFGNRGQANYSAAKAGIVGFTKTVAIELGPFGITANAIAPGYIDTAMTRGTAERLGVPIEEQLANVAAALPVRRVGLPADIANAALFFASEASGYVTGQLLLVDGGRRLL
jgi:3-oxoacyl-[acyl-carrier protein] reductase